MAKRKGGFGILPFVAAFLGLLAAAGAGGTVYFYQQFDGLTEGKEPTPGKTIPALEKQVDDARAAEKKMLERWNKLAPWVLDTKFVDAKDFDANNGDEEIKQKVIQPIIDHLGPDEFRNEKYEAQAQIAKKQNLKLTQILPAMLDQKAKLEKECEDLKGRLKTSQADLDRERKTAAVDKSALNGQLATLQTELAEQTRLVAETKLAAQAEKDRLDKQLEVEVHQHRTAIEDRNKEVSRLKNDNEVYKEKIQKLTENKESKTVALEPDGEVTAVAEGLKTAYLNLGRRQRLQRGMRFTVFSYGPGGVPRRKGEIEVLDVKEELSKAAILSVTSQRDPIVEGDLIANPIYRPSAAPNFVLCGQMTRYSPEDLMHLIEENGGKVQAKVSSDTDFVVAGGDRARYESDPNFREALQLGLRVMSEQDLLDYLPSYGGK